MSLKSLILDAVSYTYNPGTAYESKALKDVSFEIKHGEFVGLIGHTGSGKSTLIQLFNGLIRPTGGRVIYDGEDIWEEGFDRRKLRFRVGLVFQYPEQQLFEESIIKDVCFGPKNQGLDETQCKERAAAALAQVGITEDLFEKSPFDISGGQKRRAAIAGVLAMEPELLILDEPTAGLDSKGRKELLELLGRLHKTKGISIILVSHSMEDIARCAERIIVLNKGEKAFDAPVREVFSHCAELEKMGLAAPGITYLMHALKAKGIDVDLSAITVDEAKASVMKALGRG